MTANGTITYTYDAENRITATSGATYVYDGDGSRVKKLGANPKLYWRGTGMDELAESDLSGNMLEEYVFFGGKRIARRDVSVTPQVVHYYYSDHLGTASAVSDSVGTLSTMEQCDYYPYGGQAPSALCTGDPNTYKFTGKERDSESGNDYFGARYNAPSLGRFLSPDWSEKAEPVPYARPEDPQSLNLYTYTLNSPLSLADDDGHFSRDSYVADVSKHGGPHIDRYRGKQNVGRYRPDGTPIKHGGKTPDPVPSADKDKFGEAVKDLDKKIDDSTQEMVDLQIQEHPLPAPPLPEELKPDPAPAPPAGVVPLPAPEPMPTPTPPMPLPEPIPVLPFEPIPIPIG